VYDKSGQDWIVYHARLRASPSDDRDLMMNRNIWENGRSTVNAGDGQT
jgi:hypothetical protein